mgnify:CR=1 FL=1
MDEHKKIENEVHMLKQGSPDFVDALKKKARNPEEAQVVNAAINAVAQRKGKDIKINIGRDSEAGKDVYVTISGNEPIHVASATAVKYALENHRKKS